MNLSDYIQLPREQRIEHIDLTDPCTCWTGNQSWGMKKMRRELLNYFNLCADMKGYGAPCCHLCKNHSKSGTVCINPLHMYIGTAKENIYDIPETTRKQAAATARAAVGERGDGMGALTYAEQKENGRIGGVLSAQQRWRCTQTGFICKTAGGLSMYQKARGIDTNKRERIG